MPYLMLPGAEMCLVMCLFANMELPPGVKGVGGAIAATPAPTLSEPVEALLFCDFWDSLSLLLQKKLCIV